MQLTDGQQMALKAVEVEILRSFIHACDALGLRYYVIGGTLLGAVRHQGFIPWDDDIDVGMPRKDYDIFARNGQKLLPENLFIQSHHTDKCYVNNYLKIRDSSTTFIEESTKDLPINHGIFLDVFPLDNFEPNLKTEKKFSFRNRLYAERLREELYREHIPFRSKIFEAVLKMRYPTTTEVVEKREELFRNYCPDGSYWANHCGAWGSKEIIPMDWYGDGVPLSFEGMQVMAPQEYDKWLTQVYGDYMQLPPAAQRISHHETEIIDTAVSYTAYRKKECDI